MIISPVLYTFNIYTCIYIVCLLLYYTILAILYSYCTILEITHNSIQRYSLWYDPLVLSVNWTLIRSTQIAGEALF